MSQTVKRRPYRSQQRDRQAAETRAAILGAAHALFTARGYAATAVADIAARAAVSVDTVYTRVGRKPQLLLAAHDMVLGGGDAVPAEERDYVRAIRAAPSAAAKIRAYVDALGRVLPEAVPLALALREAGRDDEECRRTFTALEERRAANMRLFARDLRSTGEVRDDLTEDEVADLVWSMNGPDYFQLFASRGYSPAAYAELLAKVWTRTFLS